MLWIEALHVIFMVTWFSGLFYLPRLFVYHAMSEDNVSHERFIIMERKLFFGITTPGGILTTVFGIWLLALNWTFYSQANWMHAKLVLVAILWAFHFYCGKLWIDFKNNNNRHGHGFYRVINEVPTLILFGVIVLTIVQPF